MFDLRYHVASLAAVFLMLVVGILIGVGISGRGFVDDAERNRFNARIADLEEEVDAANSSGARRRPRTSSRARTLRWPRRGSTRRTLPSSCSDRWTRPSARSSVRSRRTPTEE